MLKLYESVMLETMSVDELKHLIEKEKNDRRAYGRDKQNAFRSRLSEERKKELNSQMAKNGKIRRRKNKQLAVEFFGSRCHDCGNTYHPKVFDFHHINPRLKERKPNELMHYEWNIIEKELKNCVMLCANCHRMRHHEDY